MTERPSTSMHNMLKKLLLAFRTTRLCSDSRCQVRHARAKHSACTEWQGKNVPRVYMPVDKCERESVAHNIKLTKYTSVVSDKAETEQNILAPFSTLSVAEVCMKSTPCMCVSCDVQQQSVLWRTSCALLKYVKHVIPDVTLAPLFSCSTKLCHTSNT